MADRTIEYMPVSELSRAARNPKRHADVELGKSVERFGFTQPIEIDERTGRIVSGHGRADHLVLLESGGDVPPDGITVDGDGRWLVPVVRGWSSKDDADAEAYIITANRLTELGGWDASELTGMLAELNATPAGLDGTGFDASGLEAMLAAMAAAAPAAPAVDPNAVPAIPINPVTKPGDIWLLGPHRIMCGDCRDPEQVATLLGDATINVAITSPPYADRRVYDESSGFQPIPPDSYVEWFAPVAANVAAHLAEDGSWFVNIKPGATGMDSDLYVLDLVIAHARQWGWHFATEFCWERTGVPKHVSRRFKNQFEPIYQFARALWKIRPDNVRHWSESAITALGSAGPDGDVGQGGSPVGDSPAERGRATQLRSLKRGYTGPMSKVQGTNVSVGESIGPGWAYPGNRLGTMAGTHEATGHSAAFPVGLPEWFVRAYTDPGDIVYDPFMGSGSTLLAAHQQDRVGFGMELSPAYCDVIARRFERHTGIVPVLASTGRAVTFAVDFEAAPEPAAESAPTEGETVPA